MVNSTIPPSAGELPPQVADDVDEDVLVEVMRCTTRRCYSGGHGRSIAGAGYLAMYLLVFMPRGAWDNHDQFSR